VACVGAASAEAAAGLVRARMPAKHAPRCIQHQSAGACPCLQATLRELLAPSELYLDLEDASWLARGTHADLCDVKAIELTLGRRHYCSPRHAPVAGGAGHWASLPAWPWT
jgi:hypothetical protein